MRLAVRVVIGFGNFDHFGGSGPSSGSDGLPLLQSLQSLGAVFDVILVEKKLKLWTSKFKSI